MGRMFAATIAELGKLQARCRFLLVLRRGIVPLFTVWTLQCDNFAHLFILSDFTSVRLPAI
jgi:hypothetical protein